MLRRMLQSALHVFGYEVQPKDNGLDMEEEFREIWRKSNAYTMVSMARSYGMYKALNYIIDNDVSGSFVECGVWRGGSSMVAAYTLMARGALRKLVLFDTFAGMSAPGEKDKDLQGQYASKQWKSHQGKGHNEWCYASLEEVQKNLRSTGYPDELVTCIKGDVRDTLPSSCQGPIALLHLDTDWYDSTKHELNCLYPLLSPNGVLIVDDYGYWQGSRLAVDEYFSSISVRPLLFRLDFTGRAMIKLSDTAAGTGVTPVADGLA